MTLSRAPDGTLTLHRDGQADVQDVRLRRAFPWTKPDEFISVRDNKGKELVLIGRLDALPADERQLVTDWLAQNSFLPLIQRVNHLNSDFGYQAWTVETDRGPANFRVQEREDIRFLPDGRFVIKDTDGNIYLLPRLADLDRESVRAVEGLL